MMELREVSVEEIQSMLEGRKDKLNKSGGKLMYMGSWKSWHKFYYTNWIEDDDGEILIQPQQRVRCKDLKLFNRSDGKEIKELVLPNYVASIETQTRSVVVDSSLDYLNELIDEDLKALSEAEQVASGNPDKPGS